MYDTLRIAICDDNEMMTAMVEEKLRQTLQMIEITDCEIKIYHSGMELLASKEAYHLVLLDIDMPEIDGFLVAEKLNQQRKKPLIIFLTSYQDLTSKGYHVKAFRYLTKPINDEAFQEGISSACKEMAPLHMAISIIVRDEYEKKYKTETVMINLHEITQVEALGTGCCLYTDDSELIVKEPLKHWKTTLPKDIFIQTHKSHLVNLNYVKRISHDKKIIYLKPNQEVPIARNQKKNFIEAFHEFAKIKGGI